MRIVGGTWRGRALEAPSGRDTRPTTDRTRESIASAVLSAFGLDLSGVRVLDAFAGSGAIGFELLSRGAASVTFVDADRKAIGAVRGNARSLGATASQARVVCGDAFRLAEGGSLPGAPFSLLVLDPPYALKAERVRDLVGALARTGQLADGAVVLYERARQGAPLDMAALAPIKSRSHGTTAVDLYRYGAHDA